MNKGDIPCIDCKTTTQQPIWWTDNVFWNNVMENKEGILCPICFIKRAEEIYNIKSWRLIPEFNWNKKL